MEHEDRLAVVKNMILLISLKDEIDGIEEYKPVVGVLKALQESLYHQSCKYVSPLTISYNFTHTI